MKPTENEPKVQLNARVPESMKTALGQVARASGMSVEVIVSDALRLAFNAETPESQIRKATIHSAATMVLRNMKSPILSSETSTNARERTSAQVIDLRRLPEVKVIVRPADVLQTSHVVPVLPPGVRDAVAAQSFFRSGGTHAANCLPIAA